MIAVAMGFGLSYLRPRLPRPSLSRMLSCSAFFTPVLLGFPPLGVSNLCCSVGRITIDHKDLVDRSRRDISEDQANGLCFI
jgi:hypothetical protein